MKDFQQCLNNANPLGECAPPHVEGTAEGQQIITCHQQKRILFGLARTKAVFSRR
jgi:hypothetical protein